MLKSSLVVLLASLAFHASACSDDCDKLVNEVCTRLGEENEGCKRARKANETASPDDKQRLCGEARMLTQRLTPKN